MLYFEVSMSGELGNRVAQVPCASLGVGSAESKALARAGADFDSRTGRVLAGTGVTGGQINAMTPHAAALTAGLRHTRRKGRMAVDTHDG